MHASRVSGFLNQQKTQHDVVALDPIPGCVACPAMVAVTPQLLAVYRLAYEQARAATRPSLYEQAWRVSAN